MTHADILTKLTSHSILPTPQRVDIASVLFAEPQHLSAEVIMERLRSNEHGVSKATVYNTLGLFARTGLVREVFADPTRVFYDSNTSHHHHLFDVEHGTLTDLPADQVRLSALPALTEEQELAGVDIIIRVRPRRR